MLGFECEVRLFRSRIIAKERKARNTVAEKGHSPPPTDTINRARGSFVNRSEHEHAVKRACISVIRKLIAQNPI